MKTSFVAITSLILSASMAFAALEPHATMAPMHKRQSIPDGLDLSAILADPSSYLKHASSLLANPSYASQFAKVTANPKFEKSISRELVSQFGSKTASIALQQYTAVFASAAPSATATSASGSDNDVSSDDSSDLASASTPSTTGSLAASQQVSGAQTSGATTAFGITFVGSAISLGAAVVLAAM